jgi:hypothetical protein
MADIVSDGFTRVAWVTTIASIALPTTTELNAGILLHDVMTSDGFTGFQADTAAVPTSKFSSTFDTSQPGRISFSGTMLRFCKQASGDTVFTTLYAKGVAGFVVVRRSLAATTAWASAQAIEVYPTVTGQGRKLDPEPNTLERWESPLMFSLTPNLAAAVA